MLSPNLLENCLRLSHGELHKAPRDLFAVTSSVWSEARRNRPVRMSGPAEPTGAGTYSSRETSTCSAFRTSNFPTWRTKTP